MIKQLRFYQPKVFKGLYKLTDEDRESGQLSYIGWNGRKAHASLGRYSWEFVRRGLLGARVTITAQNGQELPECRTAHLGMIWKIVFPDGTEYRFRSKGFSFSKSQYAWFGPDNEVLINYRYGGILKSAGDIEVEKEILESDRAFLVLLGLFLALNEDSDSSTTSAGSSV